MVRGGATVCSVAGSANDLAKSGWPDPTPADATSGDAASGGAVFGGAAFDDIALDDAILDDTALACLTD